MKHKNYIFHWSSFQGFLILIGFMLDLQREIEIEKSLLKRRILESLQFELNALLKHLELGSRKVELTPEQVKKIRQDLSELDSPVLAALKTVFDPRFQIFGLIVHKRISIR